VADDGDHDIRGETENEPYGRGVHTPRKTTPSAGVRCARTAVPAHWPSGLTLSSVRCGCQTNGAGKPGRGRGDEVGAMVAEQLHVLVVTREMRLGRACPASLANDLLGGDVAAVSEGCFCVRRARARARTRARASGFFWSLRPMWMWPGWFGLCVSHPFHDCSEVRSFVE
jgi:hypothetical protein